MSIEQPGLPPAGWFPDPTGAPLQRWWDGLSWSAHERPVEAPPVAPVAAPVPVAANPASPAVANSVPAAPVTPASPVTPVTHGAAPVARPEPAREFAEFSPQAAYPVQQAAAPAVPQYSPQPVPQAPVPAPVQQQSYRPVQQAVAKPTIQPTAQPTGLSAFAPEAPVQPMFPAPVSAISVQSPTTAAFDFRFSSPDDLGVNGRAPAFQAAAVAAAAGMTAPAAPAEPTIIAAGAEPQGPVRSSRRSAAPEKDGGPTGWATASVWVLILMPLVRAAFLAGAFYSLVTLQVGFISAAAIAVVPHLIGVLLAVSDRRRLVSNGFDRPASAAWALLGEWLYLVLRALATRRQVAGGAMAVWLWLLVLVLVGAGSYAFLSSTDLPILELVLG